MGDLFRSDGDNVHTLAIALEMAEGYHAIHQSIERVIIAYAAIDACMKTGSTLPDNDVACANRFTTIPLDTQTFGLTVATIS